jgi:hypothetical protein
MVQSMRKAHHDSGVLTSGSFIHFKGVHLLADESEMKQAEQKDEARRPE